MCQINFKLVNSILFFLVLFSLQAQHVSGIVYNKATQEPMEGVTVYFNGTTKGTITNNNGFFRLDILNEIQTSLVVSFLGYKKIVIDNYSSEKRYAFYLEEELSVLDEVRLTSKTQKNKKPIRSKEQVKSVSETSLKKNIWTQKFMLEEFKRHFLGYSKKAKSSKIINEEDLVLFFDADSMKLKASSKKPIIIKNRYLKYDIIYEIQNYSVTYKNPTSNPYGHPYPVNIFYEGTSFYTSTLSKPKKSIDKRREAAYKGSVLYFMRMLYTDDLINKGFKFYYNKEEIPIENFISLYKTSQKDIIKVRLYKPINIIDPFGYRSAITPVDTYFFVNSYGNHFPVKAISFSGYMGSQRVGDALPLDYEPKLED